jgi:alpha-mannosidase
MSEDILWSIGSPDGRSEQLVDNYKDPNMFDNVVWHVPKNNEVKEREAQKWPLFHPSEADPDFGYRLRPYTIQFHLDDEPEGFYKFQIQYLVIAPRLAHLEIKINGKSGKIYLNPSPSKSGDINLHSGLHTTIYSEGSAEVIIPAELLQDGDNTIELVSRDDGDFILVDNIEKIKRLDRMANGAGLIYQWITFSKLHSSPVDDIANLQIKPTVMYEENEDGSLVEKCHLYVELNRSIEAATLSLQLDLENKTEQIDFSLPSTAFGHLHYAFDLEDGEGEVPYTLQANVNGVDFQQTENIVRRRKWKVYITPHAHTDIGYTHRQWEVAERLCRNIDTALDYLEDDTKSGAPPAFSYHLDASWVLETYLATRSEQRIRQLFQYVKEGKIGIPHSYADLLTQYASLEDLIRNGEYTESLLRPEEMRSEYTSIVDVPSMSSSLPAVLEGSGVKYLVHANNQDRGPFRLNGGLHKISPYYWEGTNGGKVLVWLSKMYCELRKVCGSPPVNSAAERGLQMWLDEYETDSYAPDAVMLYGQEADNTDIDPQPVDFVREWNETYAYPKLIPSDVQSFFQYVESNFGDTLQTVKGDGGAYWEDGASSTIVPTIQTRETQAMLPAAEKLESLAVLHNDGWKYPDEHFDQAWRETLQYVEHTWGAFLSGPDPDALLQHDQWSVKEHFAKSGHQWAKRLIHNAAVRHSLNWNNNGREVVAYNPHSWEMSGPITVEIGKNEKVYDPNTGEELPTRRIKETTTQAIVELWVSELPGLSYRRMVLKEAGDHEFNQSDAAAESKLPTDNVTLENEYYKLSLDVQKGCVTSLLDKELDKELVNVEDQWGFGQLLYAKGGEGTRLVGNSNDLADGNPEVLEDFILQDYKVNHYQNGSSLILKGKVPYGEAEIEWSLPNEAKKVDVTFSYQKEERLEKEAVYVAFPMDLKQAEVYSDSQLGWVNWDKDELPGACKEWLPLQTGFLTNGTDADVFIASPDIPLFSVGNVVQGRWPKELDLTGSRLFSYVLNNYWHTNYKASQGGNITFRYSITSGARIEKDQAYRFGWEARRPLHGHRISFQDFREPKQPYESADQGTLAEIGSDKVVLSTMKAAKWQDGWIVRLQEIAGKTETTTLSIPGKKIIEAWETDLLEKDIKAHPVNEDGTLNIEVSPWGLQTVRIVVE